MDSNLLQAIAALVQAGAVFGGAGGALWLFVANRRKYPRATVSHALDVRRLTPDTLHVRVTVRVANTGEVLLQLCKGTVWVQQVRPWPETLVACETERNALVTADGEYEWPCLASRDVAWDDALREIEPGEQDDFHFDFFLPGAPQTVQIYSHFQNMTKQSRRRQTPIGWNTTTLHDLPVLVEDTAATRE